MSQLNVIRLVVSISLCAVVAAPTRAEVNADAEAIAEQLKSVATKLDQLASYARLAEEIPFTSLTPGEALRLADLFKDSLLQAMEDAIAAQTLTTLDDLRDAINGVFTFGSGHCSETATQECDAGTSCPEGETCEGLVTITFSNADVSSAGGTPPKVNVSFQVLASRTVTQSLTFSDEATGVKLNGGEFSLTITLATSLTFQLDTGEADPAVGFYFLTPPSIVVSVDAEGAIIGFASLVGIADVDITGNAELDLDIGVTFMDPDGDGHLTIDELVATSYADLVEVAFLEEAGNEVDITLDLDATLLDGAGTVDGTISLVDDNLTDGLNSPVVALDLLADFTNINPTQIMSGLTSLAATANAAELFGNVRLPFLNKSLAETFQFAEPLLEFLRQQTDAAIVCGTIDDNPPSGDVINLFKDDEFFCQATTVDIPLGVQWLTGTNVAVVSVATDRDTIGTNPTANVRLEMTANGRPDVKLEFTDPESVVRSVSRRFLSADELLDKLVSLAGFDDAEGNLSYDSNTKSLTYHLVKTSAPPPKNKSKM